MAQKDRVDWGEMSRVFELLADERRLYAIQCLRKAESPMTVRDLAAEIAAKERGCNPDNVSEGRITQIYTSLFHTHLPQLHKMKVIEYKRGTEYIDFSNGSPEVETVIDATSEKYPDLSDGKRK